jgi:citrate synthase
MPNAGTTAAPVPAGPGLEGIVAAQTTLSLVDGANGRLIYRGYDIDDLATHASFEEVLHLLVFGALPNRQELADLQARLIAARSLSPGVRRVLETLPRTGEPIDALRAGVTAMAMEDPTARSLEHDALVDKVIKLTAALPTIIAAFDRLRRGLEPVDPDPGLNHPANFLYMLRGSRPNDLHSQAFNTYLVLLAEHSMNASTFSARATISTISDLYAAISTALGTLKGDAHGGANQRTMEMLLEIGTPDRAAGFVEESLQVKRRLMGLGHRIYKTRDPRVNHLMHYSEALADESGNGNWHQIAVCLDEITNNHPYFLGRKLFPNVEFYSAPLLYMLGMSPDLMPAAFAVSRISGWSGHVIEQLANNRIIRPLASYIGPEPRVYVPLEQRG